MDQNNNELTVPVVAEEVHTDAIPVETGGVRVTKHTDSHDELLEQELRKGRVEVKRVKTDRVVDGPQPARRVGDTLIVPVVSEVLRIEKQWVVTEEIHIRQLEERETVQQTVTVNQEEATVERLDASGNVVSRIPPPDLRDLQSSSARLSPASVLSRRNAPISGDDASSKKKPLSNPESLLRKRP